MQKFVLSLVLSTTLLAGTAEAGQPPDDTPASWSARQAVAFAITHNPDSTIARQAIAEAQAQADMAAAADYPLVNVSAEYGQTNNPMYSFGNILNQGAFDNTIDFNDPGRTDNLQVKTEVRYRVYNGGRDRAEQNAAAARIGLSETDLATVQRQLAYEVVKTFQAIIQAEEMVTVRNEEFSAIGAALEVGRARYEAGDLLRQDLLNLELQQARASENLILSRHTLELTKRSFSNLLGLQGGNVEIDRSNGSNQEVPEHIDYRNRHELQKIAAMEQAAAAGLQKAEGGRMPTVDAFAGYQLDNGFVKDESGDSWLAGVRLNYELFDGHRTSAGIAGARIALQKIEGLRQKTELALDLEVQHALLEYRQAEERLNVTGKMVGVADEAARLSRARFKEGVILASDLIDLEMRLTDARARQLSAEAGYRVAIANLRRATGLEQFPDK
ncbi:MAG: hypothetical protein A2X81_10560 [Desulfobacterales bacterium GWB2_56_26]|nr:MAG: hypothetical protein A2X81_10560 [Desulfobacterales bacterium GWB2_56_26]